MRAVQPSQAFASVKHETKQPNISHDNPEHEMGELGLIKLDVRAAGDR